MAIGIGGQAIQQEHTSSWHDDRGGQTAQASTDIVGKNFGLDTR